MNAVRGRRRESEIGRQIEASKILKGADTVHAEVVRRNRSHDARREPEQLSEDIGLGLS